ncbi:HAD-IA family hydrolase [Herbiconiux daphne]|uniref:HAD-IA family hydrolase n=1 Tax=Herbiconiux daphne TaxID=2970914 RepID=A0ABT2H6C0_9MICO|nr:HAD-IA family hydrolase [Herbiconiux daphne]MCS5735462.1 HAD-IA family hydrolase [Herbiconiux daphne]
MPSLIFDCDGVLADTERTGHLVAFNQTFREFGVPVQWSDADYAEKVTIGGGKERMASLLTPEFVAANGLPTDADGQRALLAEWHRRKTAIYTELVDEGRLPARPGIARLVAEAAASGWLLAVASTSAEPSVRAVLEHAVGPELASRFEVYAGDVVAHKKPAPDIYLLALDGLGFAADDAVVVEDSANGLRAALAAGLRTVVTVSAYTVDEDFTGASLVVTSLGDADQPAGVLVDPFGIQPHGIVALDDVAEVLRRPLPDTTAVPEAAPAPAGTNAASGAPAPDRPQEER